MVEAIRFDYRAIDPNGRRVRGVVLAGSDAEAFEQLRRDGLSPLELKAARSRAAVTPKASGPTDRETAELVSSLADLLRAGVDMRTALSILGGRAGRPSVRSLCQSLAADISSGEAIDRAFGRRFPPGQALVGFMVAAGEASGDLSGGLQRAGEMIQGRQQLRDQLIGILAYPMFVLVSAIAAVLVILLFIVPSIAPLATDGGGAPPLALGVMIAVSNFLRTNLGLGGVVLLGGGLLATLMLRLGALSGPLELLIFEGPAKRTVCAVVYGAFSISLGTMLAAGAPIGDALRLSTRAVRSAAARRRLDPIGQAIRQGRFLSDVLAEVKGFPPAIVRLAVVGEATNTLGEMLVRGGRMEEQAAIRRIEAVGRIAGPALIVVLGAMLGLLMAGLLSGVSAVGQSVLR